MKEQGKLLKNYLVKSSKLWFPTREADLHKGGKNAYLGKRLIYARPVFITIVINQKRKTLALCTMWCMFRVVEHHTENFFIFA